MKPEQFCRQVLSEKKESGGGGGTGRREKRGRERVEGRGGGHERGEQLRKKGKRNVGRRIGKER